MQDPFPPININAPAPAPQRYSRFQALVLAFFSAELYRDVARRWRGIGLLYLLLLLTIGWLPSAIQGQLFISNFAKNVAPKALQDFPAITLTKGLVSIDRPEPYLWRDPQTKEVILYVDTTDTFDLPEGANAAARLGHNFLEARQDKYSTRRYDLSQLPDGTVDKTVVQGWLNKFSSWVGFGIFGGGLLFSMIWHLIQILLYGAIGLALCSMFRARLDYAALLRLSAVAITPAVLLSTVLWMTGVENPFSCFSCVLYLVVEMGFLAFAVKANANQVQPPGHGYAMPYPPPPLA